MGMRRSAPCITGKSLEEAKNNFSNYIDNAADKIGKDLVNDLRIDSSWILYGLNNLVVGIAKLITTPYTWFIQMPVRGYLTHDKGSPKVKDSQSLNRLITKGQKLMNDDAENAKQVFLRNF